MSTRLAQFIYRTRSALAEPSEKIWQDWFEIWLDLCKAGLPIINALELSTLSLGNSRREAKLGAQLLSVKQRLEDGLGLNKAFAEARIKVPFEIRLALTCGVKSGDLTEAGTEQLDDWRKSSKQKQELLSSLAYPLLVLSLALATWLFTSQVLRAEEIATKSSALKADLSDLLIFFGIGAGCTFYLLRMLKKAPEANQSEILFSSNWNPAPARILALHLYAIGQELKSGYSLLDTLNPQNRGLSGNSSMKAVDKRLLVFCSRLHKAVTEGQRFSVAMRASGASAFMVRQAEIAEQTGHLHSCFLIASKALEMKATALQRKLKGILGPATLIIAAASIALAYSNSLAPLYDNLGTF